MNFEGLKNRVERAEQLLEGRLDQTHTRYTALRTSWREAWTPPRILIAGFIAGFATGHTRPQHALRKLGRIGGPKSLQLISAISGLLTSIQATVAAATAEKAAQTADSAAETADEASQTADVAAENVAANTAGTDAQTAAAAGAAAAAQVVQAQDRTDSPTTPVGSETDPSRPRADRARPDPILSEQPRPAEAATDVSESGR